MTLNYYHMYSFNFFATLALVVMLSVSASAQSPQSLLNSWNSNGSEPGCEQWKITYPTGDEEKDLCNNVENNRQEFYYVNSAGNGIVFRAPIRDNNGTTPNSDYVRSELRERNIDGDSDIYWTTSGQHVVYVKQAITHLPIVKDELVATQIHGNKADGIDDAMVLRLEGSNLFLSFNGNQLRSDVPIKSNYSLGQVHEVVFQVVDGKHYCYYSEDGNLKNAFSNGNADNYLVKDGSNSVLMDLDYDQSYFKIGNYTQSNPDREGSSTNNSNNYGEVVVYDLKVDHDGNFGSPPGDGDGGSTCSAVVPSSRTVSNVGQTSATVNWSYSASFNHYNVRYRRTGTSAWSTLSSLRLGEGDFSVSSNIASKTLTGLSSNATYEWQVRAKCDDVTVATPYTSGPNFTTTSGGGGLPSPWQTADVGAVGATGSASYSSSTFTLNGSGSDIWGSSDEFRYVYQTLSGDGEIIARVASLQNTNSWAKSGVMMRESLAANSKHAMMITRPSAGTAFQRRTSTGGGSSNTSSSNGSPAIWVKMVRSGNTFTAFRSENGSSWTQAGSQTISMGSDIYVGLALTSHNDGTLATSNFTNVDVNTGGTIGGGCSTATPGSRQNGTITTSSASVSWGSTGADRYDVRFKKTADSNWRYIDNVTGTSTTITGVVESTTYEWQVQSECNDGSGGSWSSSLNFTTPNNSGGGGNPIVTMRKRNAMSYALDGDGGGANNRTIFLYDYNSNNIDQQWIEIDRGDGYYTYQKNSTNYCIDGGNGGATTNPVKLYTCSSTNQNQHWKKVSIGSGYFRLEKRNASSYSIDGKGGGTNDQTAHLWTNSNTNQNQHWFFTSVGSSNRAAVTNNLKEAEIVTEVGGNTESHLSFWPNPSQGHFTVLIPSDGLTDRTTTVNIYDMLGRVVFQRTGIQAGDRFTINESLSKGTYLLRWVSEDGALLQTDKLIRQ